MCVLPGEAPPFNGWLCPTICVQILHLRPISSALSRQYSLCYSIEAPADQRSSYLYHRRLMWIVAVGTSLLQGWRRLSTPGNEPSVTNYSCMINEMHCCSVTTGRTSRKLAVANILSACIVDQSLDRLGAAADAPFQGGSCSGSVSLQWDGGGVLPGT